MEQAPVLRRQYQLWVPLAVVAETKESHRPWSGCRGRGRGGLITGGFVGSRVQSVTMDWGDARPLQRVRLLATVPWTQCRGGSRVGRVEPWLQGRLWFGALKHLYYSCSKGKNVSSLRTVIFNHPTIFERLRYSFLCNLHEMRF